MSASTKRKNRQAARAAGTDKKAIAAQEAAQKARKSRRKWTIGTIAVLLCIALVLFFSSPLFYRITVAETIGGQSFSPAEISFYKGYYGDYTAYLTQVAARLDYAEEHGLRLSAEEKDAMAERAEAQMEWFDAFAEMNNISTSTFMSSQFGAGVNESVIRGAMEDDALAQKAVYHKYSELHYTPEELDAYYEDPADGDLFSYAVFLVTANDERSMEEAQAAAEAVVASFTDGQDGETDAQTLLNDILAEDFPNDTPTVHTDELGANVDAANKAWITDPARSAGDIYATAAPNDTGWYVVLFLGRSDNTEPVVTVRHILILAEADENGVYTDEAKAEAEARANELLEAWKAGDQTEADFATLATLFSDDSATSGNGGLYNTRQGQSVAEFDAFCFADREYGETAVVYGENPAYAGYHVIFYVEKLPARQVAARDALSNAAMNAWVEEIAADLTPEQHWAYRLVKK